MLSIEFTRIYIEIRGNYIVLQYLFIIFSNIIDLNRYIMRKITLRQVLRAIVIAWIAIVAFQIYKGVQQQIREVTSGYKWIDPLQSDSPDIRLLGGYVVINRETISESPDMVRKLAIRGSIIRNLSQFLQRVLVVLVLLNIFQLLKTWNFSHLFMQENTKIIRRFSWLFLGWVVVYFLLYEIASFIFTPEYIVTYNWVLTLNFSFQGISGIRGLFYSFRSIRHGLGQCIQEEALVVFFLLFIFSITMKKGIKLQEEADLTI